jgi:nucleotide-binding universal stress UspA family protein
MMSRDHISTGGAPMLELNEVLVPVDFSASSRSVYARALGMLSGDEPVIILHHVLDPTLAEFAEDHDLGQRSDVMALMRARAERELAVMQGEATGGVEVQSVISEGVPFFEIIRKADEFAVDAVIMGKRGVREHPESLFFGSTAERVTRGCNQPVIVLGAS